MGKQIYIGSDHAGFKLKGKIKKWLKKNEIPFEDLGNLVYNPKDDYPDFAFKVARKVAKEKTFGILLCGSAHGMCIAANKIKGVRAVVTYSVKGAMKARQHNDANIICLSGWHSLFFRATRILKAFLTTPFSKEERHVRRLGKIKKIEEGKPLGEESKKKTPKKKHSKKKKNLEILEETNPEIENVEG